MLGLPQTSVKILKSWYVTESVVWQKVYVPEFDAEDDLKICNRF